MKILVVNTGSSSHKLSLYDLQNEAPAKALWTGSLDWGREEATCLLSAQAGKQGLTYTLKSVTSRDALQQLVNSLWEGPTKVISHASAIEKIGHRVVHGGAVFQQPTLITKTVKEQIRQLIPLAPLHNPANLEGIELMEQFFPHTSQIAIFDTAFHTSMPEKIKTYPLPLIWKEKGIQRYGFHGISHQYCAECIEKKFNPTQTSLKIINCHLGNGASLCAIQNGKSYDTTMGFTPLEGLMMGTRCGSIDPGIVLYLMREHHLSVAEVESLLNFESGLKGIGKSSDMREILAKKESDAQLAFDMYVQRIKSFIGALAASLGGLDVLSFTGGIGEHAAPVRAATCQGLEFLGLQLDLQKNQSCQPDQDVATKQSVVRILVLHTEEEWMIARACFIYERN